METLTEFRRSTKWQARNTSHFTRRLPVLQKVLRTSPVKRVLKATMFSRYPQRISRFIGNADLNNLKYPKILDYDAVFMNSGDGPVFADPQVMSGLIRFVREGGGLAGLHGASYASPDVPEFGELIGAQTGPHKEEDATLKIDDPDSPLTRQFASSPLTAQLGGKGFAYRDEFYHFLPTGPYSREKLHVLISLDAERSDLSKWHVRPDKDYGLVWIKKDGDGRVFNCAMGHTPTLFEIPAMSQMIFNAIQFVLGDLPADTTPSAVLARK
jgi:type 1 glutamine amidotransferase